MTLRIHRAVMILLEQVTGVLVTRIQLASVSGGGLFRASLCRRAHNFSLFFNFGFSMMDLAPINFALIQIGHPLVAGALILVCE